MMKVVLVLACLLAAVSTTHGFGFRSHLSPLHPIPSMMAPSFDPFGLGFGSRFGSGFGSGFGNFHSPLLRPYEFNIPMRRYVKPAVPSPSNLFEVFNQLQKANPAVSHSSMASMTMTEKGCEIHVEETPTYDVSEVEDGKIVTLQMKHAKKEDLAISVEDGKLFIRAPFSLTEEPENQQSEEVAPGNALSAEEQMDISTETAPEVEEADKLVIVEAEDEDDLLSEGVMEKKEEHFSDEERKVPVVQAKQRSLDCDILGEYSISFQLSKNVVVDGISAQFENGVLQVHLPHASSKKVIPVM